MNWKEAKSKWQESMGKWESIKNDLSQYDFLKTAYLVVCWNYGQAKIEELKHPLGLSRHIDLIKQAGIKKEILSLNRETINLESLKRRNHWIEMRINFLERQKVRIVENNAELVENWPEIRFNKLDFKGIAELKKHPLINKDSYGIRIILNEQNL